MSHLSYLNFMQDNKKRDLSQHAMKIQHQLLILIDISMTIQITNTKEEKRTQNHNLHNHVVNNALMKTTK